MELNLTLMKISIYLTLADEIRVIGLREITLARNLKRKRQEEDTENKDIPLQDKKQTR